MKGWETSPIVHFTVGIIVIGTWFPDTRLPLSFAFALNYVLSMLFSKR